MNIEQIVERFSISADQIPTDCDLLVILDSDWKDSPEPYQIEVNGVIREIEGSKVNKHNEILFIDTESKQVTVLSLEHNKSSTQYKYRGETILYAQVGYKSISLVSFYDTLILTKSLKKGKKEETKLPDSYENRELLTKEYIKAKSLLLRMT
tara:strand:+ start:5442 stop:5897 length:456 start_codon:yes stop_codon:yes gene_type:complete